MPSSTIDSKIRPDSAIDEASDEDVSLLHEHVSPIPPRPSFLARLFPSRQRKARFDLDRIELLDGHRATITGEPNLNHGCQHSSPRPSRPSTFSCLRRLAFKLLKAMLLLFGVLHILEVTIGHWRTLIDLGRYDEYMTDWGRPGHLGEGLSHYTTDITRDVEPIACHSHNDYWRRIPLFEALHYGCMSIEADVWRMNDDDSVLFVGHNTAALSQNRTFHSLYVGPLVDILDRMNAPNPGFDTTHDTTESLRGVFDADPAQTLVLLVDLKTSGPATFAAVHAQLAPLREKGYLSYWTSTTGFHSGPITVVGTGNTPFTSVLEVNTTTPDNHRDIFLDAPLISMTDDPHDLRKPKPTPEATYDSSNSYYASASLRQAVGIVWPTGLTRGQRALVAAQIRGAKARDLHPRYWETPGWPRALRNEVWRTLVDEGVDVLNVDDLVGATRGDWGRRRYGFFM